MGVPVCDIRETATSIGSSGGKIRSQIWTPRDDEEYQCVYCEDPRGTLIELNNHCDVQVRSNHERLSNGWLI
jgi:predicted enzyme related to lactoylglutathione lyase